MNENLRNNELFRTSHIVILISYTISCVFLIGESLLLDWEKWAIILIVIALCGAWTIHISRILNEYIRLWVYSVMMMVTYFFYGIHATSTYDLCAVMMGIIMLYTMTGEVKFMTLCQVTFLVTYIYDITGMILSGTVFDELIVTRSILHLVLVFMSGWIGRVIIDRWIRVLGNVSGQIRDLKEETDRINDFLVNVSHEIRTPVNAIIGFSGVCIEKEKDAEIKSNMESILIAGKRISDQIGDILDFSEIDRKSLTANIEEYMPASLINDVISKIGPYINPHIELILDIEPSVPAVLKSDAVKLRKIFDHLIENSLKYTKAGGVYVHVSALKQEYGINLLIDVEDTGIGMDESDANKAVQGLYQKDSSRTRQGGGLGLGLSIVSGFVSSLGGFMNIKSKEGVGTQVHISIPQEVVNPENCMSLSDKESLCLGAFIGFSKFSNPDVRENYSNLMKTVVEGLEIVIHRVESLSDLVKLSQRLKFTHLLIGREEYEQNPEFMEKLAKHSIVVVAADSLFRPKEGSGVLIMKKPVSSFMVTEILNMRFGEGKEAVSKMTLPDVRALVVDDEPMNLAVAKGILIGYGMNVETVISGYKAVQYCDFKDYDVIFMDHMMPGMDGVETAEKIRSNAKKQGKRLVIVALTANAVSSAKDMFLAHGFDGFISKPIDIAELERVLKRVIPKEKIKYELLEEPKKNTESKLSEDKDQQMQKEQVQQGKEPSKYPCMTALLVDYQKGISYCRGDENFYVMLLKEYVNEYPEKLKNITYSFEKGDIKNYEIYVHALKSTSKMIGAMKLSEIAKGQEMSAGNGEMPADIHEQMLAEYKKLIDAIKKDLGIGDEEPQVIGGVIEFAANNSPEVT